MTFLTFPRQHAPKLLLAIVLFGGCLTAPQRTVPGTLVSRVMTLDGVTYPYVVYLPAAYDPKLAYPSVLMIHGGGGSGPDFINTWTASAEQKGIILVAPTLDLSAAAETRVPVVFPKLMDAVNGEWNVGSARRYLFGYSAGGYFVYDAALLRADYFAGAGIFAAVIQPAYDDIVRRAPRPASVAIYLGDRDQYFSLAEARRTRDLLLSNGMNVHYVELSNQDHDYTKIAASVNADLWAYFESRRVAP